MPPWSLVAIGVSLTAALLGLWLWRLPGPDARLADDGHDPYRGWVQNAFLLVTGDCDYAHLGGAEARRILAHWWDVYGPLEHRRALQQLAREEERDHAWPLLRYILISRLGVAAGMLADEVSWSEILPIARRLQAAYPGWRAMAQAYVQARRQWKELPLDGSGDDDGMITILDNLARLDDTRWKERPWSTELRLAESEGDAHG